MAVSFIDIFLKKSMDGNVVTVLE